MQNNAGAVINYVQSHHDEYLAGFQELLRLRSVSTDPVHHQDVIDCAQWIVREATRIGLKNAEALPTDGHPVVYAEYLEAGEDQPTILFYAHYDVQPPDPLELWQSPPFEPTVHDGKLFARGSADNKAGVFVTLKAFEAYFSTLGRLPVNVKVIFEGEEESGSPSIERFLSQNKERLIADYLIVNDGTNAPDQPIVPAGVRGIISGEVKVQGPKQDLHSGSYGGWVQNPLHMVSRIIASFHDATGRVAIPHFYDGVDPLNDEEKNLLSRAVMNGAFMDEMIEESGVKSYWAEAVAPLGERMWAQPCIDVNGMQGGYQGIGTKTIIPAEASFKFSARLAPGQEPGHIQNIIDEHIKGFEDEWTKISITFESNARAVKSIPTGKAADAIKRAFVISWGKEPLIYPEGGSVPLLGIFDRDFDNMPILSMAYVTGGGGHSPNEFIYIDSFHRGIECAVWFLEFIKKD